MAADVLPEALVREGFAVLATVGGPYMGALLVVGMLVGIFQAATQINDPAVSFLPRLVTGLAVAAVLGAWTVQKLAAYVVLAFGKASGQL